MISVKRALEKSKALIIFEKEVDRMNKKEWIKNNAHTILTVVGCVSTIITTGLAIKAGMNVADICEEEGWYLFLMTGSNAAVVSDSLKGFEPHAAVFYRFNNWSF